MLLEWGIIQYITRIGLYVTLSGVVGGIGSFYFISLYAPSYKDFFRRYIGGSACIGALLSILYFWTQIGGSVNEGWLGSFNKDIALLLYESPIGDFFKYGLLGYFSILFSVLFGTYFSYLKGFIFSGIKLVLKLLGVIFLLNSYVSIGHSVSEPWYVGAALWVHVAVAAWWIGSLLPLWWIMRSSELIETKKVLEYFGQIASVPVVILIFCGIVMTYVYLGFGKIWFEGYGKILFLKVVLVIALLALALHHKIHRVPNLITPDSLKGMKRSVLLEAALMVIVISLTSYISTFISIH